MDNQKPLIINNTFSVPPIHVDMDGHVILSEKDINRIVERLVSALTGQVEASKCCDSKKE